MTTPDVPLRFEFAIEVPGPPEQVWDALATANGISSWMMPTDGEEGLGGTLVFHMGEGEGESSPAEITAGERPTRVAYIEPEWATLMGQDKDAAVTPLATEFLVEATSGGTCIVRVVTSAALIMVVVFGTFALTGVPQIKEIGVGLAVAIALDATIVRLILVPTTMELMGDKNWWIPKWLDRVLPDMDFESSGSVPHTEEAAVTT